jgi:putative flippase GtrA
MKAISFGLVGVVNTLVDLGVFWIALKIIGLPLLLANLLAWLVAVSGSYILNCFTTFAAESGRKLEPRKYASFIASGVAGFVGGHCHARYRGDFRSNPNCETSCDRHQLRFEFFVVALCDFPSVR